MNVCTRFAKSAFAVAAITASLVIISSAESHARGAGPRGFSGNVRDHRVSSPPPLASPHTTVQRPHGLAGCGRGGYCATSRANGGVIVTTTGGGAGRPRPRR